MRVLAARILCAALLASAVSAQLLSSGRRWGSGLVGGVTGGAFNGGSISTGGGYTGGGYTGGAYTGGIYTGMAPSPTMMSSGGGGGGGGGRGGGGILSRLETRLENRFGNNNQQQQGGGGGYNGGGSSSGVVPPVYPSPSPSPRTTGFVANQQLQTASGTQSQALGDAFNQPAPRASGTSLRDSFSASAARPASGSLISGQQPLTLKFKNSCRGTYLQALAHVRDPSSGNYKTFGFIEIKPDATVDAATTADRTVFVYAQEKGKSCDGGGRCWRGEAGPFSTSEGQSFKFTQVQLPDNNQGSATYVFQC